jgi:acyl-CoA thioester hydrolase
MIKTNYIPSISDTNLARHVRADVILTWIVEGYAEIRKLFTLDPMTLVNIIMANINVDYKSEVILGEDVEMTTVVKHIGNSSFVVEHEVFQGDQLCARGRVTFVHYNYSNHKPESIPPEIRLKLKEHLAE